MQYTTHFNLNLPEGTDVVNPLVQDNPNYTAIDAAMFANKQAVIGSATELTSGTAHAITRANTDSNYFRYTATSNWTAGDTMTVDGTTVSVYLSDGTTPDTGSYVINTEVLAFINGTRVTLITSSSDPSASEISYNNAGSGLASGNVQDAIDELNVMITKSEITSNTLLDPYNSASNKYTFNGDGYLYLSNTNGNNGGLFISGSDDTNFMIMGGNEGYFSLFVRKGMKCYCFGSIDNAYFMPLS